MRAFPYQGECDACWINHDLKEQILPTIISTSPEFSSQYGITKKRFLKGARE